MALPHAPLTHFEAAVSTPHLKVLTLLWTLDGACCRGGLMSPCEVAVAKCDTGLRVQVHLPATCRRSFEPHLEATLPCVVTGLADESEEVRGTSMAAARKIVDFYATTSTPLLLPVLEVSNPATCVASCLSLE